jgi:hypothetical protein
MACDIVKVYRDHGVSATRLRERISLARTSCLLWSDSDRIDASQRNAALCQKQTHAAQQKAALFDHLVGSLLSADR